MRKFLITGFVLLGTLCLLLGGAFVFREDLVRYAAGRFLADGQLTLTRLQGMQVSATQLTVDELEFLLNESGQRLVLSDLDVSYRVNSLISAPQVNAIAISSAQLLAAESTESGGAAEDDDTEAPGMLLSEVLTLLREFPLASVRVDALTIPQRSVPIALMLERGDGRLQVQAESGALRLQAGFTQAEAAADARLTVALTRANTSVGNFELVLSPRGEVYALAGDGAIDIPDVNALLDELGQSPAGLPLRAAQLGWSLAGEVANDLSGNGAGGDGQRFALGFEAGSTVTLREDLASGLGALTIEFTDSAALTVSSGAGLTVSSSGLPLRVLGNWNDQAANIEAQLRFTECELSIDTLCSISFDGAAGWAEYSVAGNIAATLQGAGKYRLATQNLVLAGLPEWLPAFDIDAELAEEAGAISFSTPLILRNGPGDAGISLEGDYDRTTSALDMNLDLPQLAFMEEGGALSAWFKAWPFTFDLLTGSLAAEAELTWATGALTGVVAAELNEVGGFYEDYFFGGVSGALQADVDSSAALPLATPPLSLSAAALDIGVPMENLRLDFSLDHAGLFHIDTFSTELLDGTITGADITYDFNRERNDVLVTFSGLQIERMLDLVEYKGIAATGAVSGAIPLTITPTGVEVAEGRLSADEPGGSIRYLAAATGGDSGNAGLDLVNQALSNYQFESLESGIEYRPDGELLLEMKLQGHNPAMQGGQRINLNLNLSDNIPALLESLQAARRIEDFLELQYQ